MDLRKNQIVRFSHLKLLGAIRIRCFQLLWKLESFLRQTFFLESIQCVTEKSLYLVLPLTKKCIFSVSKTFKTTIMVDTSNIRYNCMFGRIIETLLMFKFSKWVIKRDSEYRKSTLTRAGVEYAYYYYYCSNIPENVHFIFIDAISNWQVAND